MDVDVSISFLKEGEKRAASRDLLSNLPDEMLYGNKKYSSTVELSRRYVDTWISTQVPAKVFLDYACGNGDWAIQSAKAGAKWSLAHKLRTLIH